MAAFALQSDDFVSGFVRTALEVNPRHIPGHQQPFG